MSTNNPIKHQFRIKIEESDIDAMGHVNNVVYLRWVQEAAASHWNAIGGEFVADHLWVVIRHEIDYLKPILPHDQVVAETYVMAMEGAKSERHTVIYAEPDKTVFAKIVTNWCLIDAVSKRPKRIDKAMSSVFMPD